MSSPGSDFDYYLDYIDKPYSEKYEQNSNNASKSIYSCCRGWIQGDCERGHSFAKAIMCDKEWCPDCGKKQSNIHRRRVARWWGKIMPMKSVGYLVITIPDKFRNDFYNRKLLSAFRRYIIVKMKKDSFDLGLSRWHWAGSCKNCKEKGCEKCNYTGMSDVWSPHLNILFENGYEPFVTDPENWVNRYKEDVALHMCELINKYRIIEKAEKLAQDLNCDFEEINLKNVKLENYDRADLNSIVLHYRYVEDESRKIHLNNYVNRASWRYDDNYRVLNTIKGYRTTQSWGNFPKPKEERTSELVALENGCCPECEKEKIKSKITWGTFESSKNVEFDYRYVKRTIDAGYFLLHLPTPVDEVEEFDSTGIFDKVFKGKYRKIYGSN